VAVSVVRVYEALGHESQVSDSQHRGVTERGRGGSSKQAECAALVHPCLPCPRDAVSPSEAAFGSVHMRLAAGITPASRHEHPLSRRSRRRRRRRRRRRSVTPKNPRAVVSAAFTPAWQVNGILIACTMYEERNIPTCATHATRAFRRRPDCVPIATLPHGRSSQHQQHTDTSPGTPLAARPLQHRQVAAFGSSGARVFIPRGPLTARPLQYLHVAALGSGGACVCNPWAPLPARPLQKLQVTTTGGALAYVCKNVHRSWRSPRHQVEVPGAGSRKGMTAFLLVCQRRPLALKGVQRHRKPGAGKTRAFAKRRAAARCRAKACCFAAWCHACATSGSVSTSSPSSAAEHTIRGRMCSRESEGVCIAKLVWAAILHRATNRV
jgi:hypothetical protein